MTLPVLMDRNQVARTLFGVERAADAWASVDAVFRAVPEALWRNRRRR